ncbi:MAG: signal peptidase II [Actinobacteria bacterium]|nr:signal peptidase II [Actinomycetota bacterium]
MAAPGTEPGTEPADAPEPSARTTPAPAPERPEPPRRHLGLLGATVLAALAVDQLSKDWALRRLPRGPVHVVASLDLRLARNSGAAFSIGGGKGLGPFIAVLALVVVGVLVAGSTPRTRPGAVAAGLVAAGALGNLADRLFRSGAGGFMQGAVVDFVDLGWWPIFNLADSAIVTGAVLLVGRSLRPAPRT